MAFEKTSLFLLASIFLGLSAAFTEEAVDCCLSTSDIPIPHRIVDSYIILNKEGGCPIPAVVFITKKDRRLCSPLPSGKNWVSKLICKIKPRGPECPKSPRKKRRGNKH
ncbi:hypothetical protein AGOR_G00050050 [Albula goreensis]|uniref:C-C motif chemokine n=1 Tax=Albula goreensis TaxID=1534307 RepID=A0A8T3DSP2_9TELE|nr:hypothetical protein AGOR_G00050050 [Albula goreensis]